MALPEAADWAGLTIPGAAVGFEVRQGGPAKPVEISLLKVTAPGIDLKAWGTIRPPAPPAEEPAEPPKSGEKSKGRPKAPATEAPPLAPPAPWRPPSRCRRRSTSTWRAAWSGPRSA